MARPRNPVAKQRVSGSHPERLKGRTELTRGKPLGEPYARMSEAECAVWRELADSLPWLQSSHRILVRLACKLAAEMDEGDFAVNRSQVLSAVLSKLGATPVDSSRVQYSEADDEDPAERFFSSRH